jgi:hypothetical protein
MVEFQLDESVPTSVDLFDALGRNVLSPLETTTLDAGFHAIPFDATPLPSGNYIVRITMDDEQVARRLTVRR